ncbi:MAG: TMEM165/GDT1 family protein [Gammaproteobacteria bacterium]
MKAFLVSAITVASAEIGDKTQFLAMVLATRYKKPFIIILGIVIATLLNHLLAGVIGEWLGTQFKPSILHIVLACSYLIAAIWVLLPEKAETDEPISLSRGGMLFAIIIAFFLAEMGDKTQVATAMLAANYQSLFQVVLGSTLGMLIANIPAVFIGNKVSQFVPVRLMRAIAASIFVVLALVELKAYW